MFEFLACCFEFYYVFNGELYYWLILNILLIDRLDVATAVRQRALLLIKSVREC